jgi:hypothetical protein
MAVEPGGGHFPEAALTEISALVAAAIVKGPVSLSVQLGPVAARLGGNCGTSPAAVETRLREVLGLGAGTPPGAEADLFPLTCWWCKNTPATHLLITDVQLRGRQAAERIEHRLCAACAHQTLVLPPEFTGWWLFELVPDHCEEG